MKENKPKSKEYYVKEIKENAEMQLKLQKSIKAVGNASEKLVEIFVELLLKIVEKQKENAENLNQLVLHCNTKQKEVVENPENQQKY